MPRRTRRGEAAPARRLRRFRAPDTAQYSAERQPAASDSGAVKSIVDFKLIGYIAASNEKGSSAWQWIVPWSRRLAVAGLGQIVVQGIGFCCGILIVRRLLPQEYAFYTLALTMLGTMNVLADCGIANGMIAEGGRVWQDRVRLGSVLSTGLALRRKFAWLSVVVSAPLLLVLLRRHGASWPVATTLVVLVSGTFGLYLAASLYEIAPRLHQRVGDLQRVGIAAAVARLSLLGLTLGAWPFAGVAAAAAFFPQLLSSWWLNRLSRNYADPSQPPDAAVKKTILTTVSRVAPAAVYYCASGQISVWLLSIFGSTAAIAQVGALGRLGQIMTLLTAVAQVVVVPRFACLPADSRSVPRRFIQVMSAMAMLSAAMVVLVAVFPTYTLFVLGAHYSGLRDEAVLLVMGSCLGACTSIAYTLGAARQWVLSPVVMIGSDLVLQLAGACIFDVGTVKGVLMLGLIPAGWNLAAHLVWIVYKARARSEVTVGKFMTYG